MPASAPAVAPVKLADRLRLLAIACLVTALSPLVVSAQSTPYNGMPFSVPGTFEATAFDLGGEGVAYHDVTPPPTPANPIRTDESVQIRSDGGSGYVIDYFDQGEWLKYTINVTTGGAYDITVLAANNFQSAIPSFHIEIDGVNVTGTVSVPLTGGWTNYQWVTARTGIGLSLGQHVLTITSETPYFDVRAIGVVTSAGAGGGGMSAPYNGTPLSVPGTFEASEFDLGGEAVAYHDVTPPPTPANPIRTDETVQIRSDGATGYVIYHFDEGEWLNYTIDVAVAGRYDIAALVANNYQPAIPKFHIEIDGVNVTGTVNVPGTGGWTNYQWISAGSDVELSAGQHVLRIVSETPYFDLHALDVASASGGGTDSTTGFTWPPNVWGGSTGKFQLLVDGSTQPTQDTIGQFMVNEIRTVTGHKGTPTRALYSEIMQSGCCGQNPQGGGATQDPYHIFPSAETGDLYISFWRMYQSDLAEMLAAGDPWRVLFEVKTAGDFRFGCGIVGWGPGTGLKWQIQADNDANGGLPREEYWREYNTSVAVPIGEWFKFEVFWHRSTGNDGRIWMAVNGQVIADHFGPNIGVNNAPINRIMISQVYSGSPYPIYQWQDDVQIWSIFPTAQAGDAWYDPPYAPH
jgi:hypothetical protein